MSDSPLPLNPRFPPHLTMDEYVDFIEASLRTVDPAVAARQKALEEKILVPFRIRDDAGPEAERNPSPEKS